MKQQFMSIKRDRDGEIIRNGIEEEDREDIGCLYYEDGRNYVILRNGIMIETPHTIEDLRKVFDL